MIKFSVLIRRKQGMSYEEFHRYWKEEHGPRAMQQKDFMSHIRRYVQSHQVAEERLQDLGHGGFRHYDGIVELWADSVEEVKRAFATRGYLQNIRPDEANFCDDSEVIVMVTEDLVIKGGEGSAPQGDGAPVAGGGLLGKWWGCWKKPR